MPYIRKKNPTYKWPVTVTEPEDGDFATYTFDARFRRLTKSAFTKLVEKTDAEMLEAVLEGWEGYMDESDKEIPCNPATRKEAYDDPYLSKALMRAYLDSLDDAREKN